MNTFDAGLPKLSLRKYYTIDQRFRHHLNSRIEIDTLFFIMITKHIKYISRIGYGHNMKFYLL